MFIVSYQLAIHTFWQKVHRRSVVFHETKALGQRLAFSDSHLLYSLSKAKRWYTDATSPSPSPTEDPFLCRSILRRRYSIRPANALLLFFQWILSPRAVLTPLEVASKQCFPLQVHLLCFFIRRTFVYDGIYAVNNGVEAKWILGVIGGATFAESFTAEVSLDASSYLLCGELPGNVFFPTRHPEFIRTKRTEKQRIRPPWRKTKDYCWR